MDLVYFSGNVIFWSLMPLVEKSIISSFTSLELSLLRYFMAGLIAIVLYLVCGKYHLLVKYDSNTLCKMGLVTILGYLGLVLNYNLLNKYDANYVFAIVYPLTLISLLAFGYFFFDENINIQRIVGILIISFGIIVVYTSK